jgi:hypothetical protein
MRSVNHLLFKLWDSEKVHAAIGGKPIWHDAETLAAIDYEMEINPEDARPVNRTQLQEQALLLYDALQASPLVNPYVPLTDLLEAFKKNPETSINPDMAKAVMLLASQPELLEQIMVKVQEMEATQGAGGGQ